MSKPKKGVPVRIPAAAALALVLSALGTMRAAARPLPLPGYSSLSAASFDFPPTQRLIGESRDPLAEISVQGEDLRDAVISPPSSALLLKGLRGDDPRAAANSFYGLGTSNRVSAVSYLTNVLLKITGTPELRAAAAVALGRIADRSTVEPLGAALNDPAAEVRYAAALALGRVPADGAATLLSNTLRSDPSWWVRYAAAIALGRTKKSFISKSLKERLQLEPQWQVRLQIVRSLQDLAGAQAAEAITLALRDEDSGVRTAAALALAEIGGDLQLPALHEALAVETDLSARSVLSAAYRRVLAKP